MRRVIARSGSAVIERRRVLRAERTGLRQIDGSAGDRASSQRARTMTLLGWHFIGMRVQDRRWVRWPYERMALEIPECAAMERHDQCVADSGVVCRVSCTILSMVSWGIDGLRPRPLATLPMRSTPSASKRARHASTVPRPTPTRSAMTLLATPSAASNRPLAWRTSRCGRELDRAMRSSSARCSTVISSGAAGRLAMTRKARPLRASNGGHYTRESQSHRLQTDGARGVSESQERQSDGQGFFRWWATLPGVLTGVAALISAVAAIFAVTKGDGGSKDDGPVNGPTTTTSTTTTTVPVPSIRLENPVDASRIPRPASVSGVVSGLPTGATIWVLTQPIEGGEYQPDQRATVDRATGRWTGTVYAGDPRPLDAGKEFNVLAVISDANADRQFQAYVDENEKTQDYEGLRTLPAGAGPIAQAKVVRE